jgi:cytochrome P450
MSNPCPVSALRNFPFKRHSVTEVPEEYALLRRTEPVERVVFPTGDEGYVVTRYEDAKFVLSDARFSRAETIKPNVPRFSALDFPAGSLFTMDPPEHTRLRKLVAAQFTPRRVESLVPRIRQITDRLLDVLAAASRPADLNTYLAFPLPMMVICELLGVPELDRERFRGWADASVSLTRDPNAALKQQKEMAFYFSQLIEKKRHNGAADLLSALITAHDERGTLSQMELIVMTMSLLVAGFETTGSVIGTGALTMLLRPELAERVRSDESSIEPIVEEILRMNPIGDGGPVRVALEDVQIAGVLIPKGSLVIASVSSANFDDTQFENAASFNAGRANDRHLAFGHGVHFCLGAALARAELQIVLPSLFKRFPTLKLAVPVQSLRMKSGGLFHRIEQLPLSW